MMSANDVLAANLWLWPDPLMKCNGVGQVIFVNAAFLQIYGGSAHDWSGKTVEGWPPAVRNGAQRFETRIGAAGEETIFDWVQMRMDDGNVMAIARNVTALITQAKAQANPPAAPQAAAVPQPVAPQPLAVVEAEPAAQVVSDNPPLVQQAAAPTLTPQELSPEQPGVAEKPSVPDTPIAPALEPQAEVKAPSQQPAVERRMTERRALPIKDSTNILGSNWRDQVIAKAVGTEIPPDMPSENTAFDGGDDLGVEGGIAEGVQILLAEDNAINALLTRTLLEAEGAHVTTVEDGALAVDAVKKKTYDLIIMDMRMPNMDGLEATRKIRAMGGKCATMPIIALTANAFDDDRNACFDSGMNDFMTKPVSAEELAEMVKIWIHGEQAQEQLAS